MTVSTSPWLVLAPAMDVVPSPKPLSSTLSFHSLPSPSYEQPSPSPSYEQPSPSFETPSFETVPFPLTLEGDYSPNLSYASSTSPESVLSEIEPMDINSVTSLPLGDSLPLRDDDVNQLENENNYGMENSINSLDSPLRDDHLKSSINRAELDSLRKELLFVIEPLVKEGEKEMAHFEMHQDMMARLTREW